MLALAESHLANVFTVCYIIFLTSIVCSDVIIVEQKSLRTDEIVTRNYYEIRIVRGCGLYFIVTVTWLQDVMFE